MSNISPFGSKNPPWARGGTNTAGSIVNQANQIQQQILTQNALGQMGATGMVQYQQPQVFQTPINMQQQNLGLGISQLGNATAISMPGNMGSQLTNQIFSQVGAVTYPTPRSLNPNAFQNSNVNQQDTISQSGNSSKQRVFTGTVTKVHDNFGFVDDDVFFQTSVCGNGLNPAIGDRVLVEASFNANMPFKWNATRIQVLPTSGSSISSSRHSAKTFASGNSYNAVPPPSESTTYSNTSRMNQRLKSTTGRGRSRERSRDDDENERKKRREERARDRDEKDKKISPSRRRSRSPKRSRRPVLVPRYMVHIPKISLDLKIADYLEVRRRYANLYVPSDFFSSYFRWVDAFPPNAPFTLNKPCSFYTMYKDVDPVVENHAVLEPPDADYTYSAKVMLLSMPTMQEIYQRCCSMAEDKEKRDRESEERDFIHPTRLFNFLVGLRGKNETMALGGPWSPSLDGLDPGKDPSVLIKTAIRTCQALTGIDLSTCTQWYRFVELFYRRGETMHKGKMIPARVETVVLFLPDVWSCVPTRGEWDGLQADYKKKLEQKLCPTEQADSCDGATTADEKDDEYAEKLQPTHYSELDPKAMNVNDLRKELKARSLNSKGLKSQLIARLSKALKVESTEKNVQDENSGSGDVVDGESMDLDISKSADFDEKDDEKPKDEEKIDEKERAMLEKRYTLPESPHIIVHPSRTAKSGKFDCTVMSLSLLLDYRPEDTKEHSFEVSLFAELFNEMLMRDFGFYIYTALHSIPDKPKEACVAEKDDKKRASRDDDKKKEDALKKKDEKEEKRKEEKGDEKKTDCDDNDNDEGGDKDRKRSIDREREKKKKDRSKTVTIDPKLLLSFVYFDQTHCGYIFEKDIEDLLFTLGLHLSRAQVRKLVSKVVVRDSLHYRKLTDKTKEEIETSQPNDSTKVGETDTLALGNRELLSMFNASTAKSPELSKKGGETSSTDQEIAEGYVMYQGGLLHVEKLMSQLKRIEQACTETEGRLLELKNENKKLSEKNSRAANTIKDLAADLKDYKDRLHVANSNLERITTCSKLFYGTLKDIRKQIDPVLNYKLFTESETNRSNSHETRWNEPDDKTQIKTFSSSNKSEMELKQSTSKKETDSSSSSSVVEVENVEVKEESCN